MTKVGHNLIIAVLSTVAAYTMIAPVWIARLFNRVVTSWSPEARQAWKHGGVMLVSNHPSLVETAVLPGLFWHPAWLGDTKCIPWSVADEYLFGGRPWLYEALRCIAVSRNGDEKGKSLNRQSVKAVLKRLRAGGIIITYPEGGRTCKGEIKYSSGERGIRYCQTKLISLALRKGYVVIPVWIEHGVVIQPESFWHGYKKLFFGPKMKIYFGQPLPRNAKGVDEATVAEAILNAGK